MNEPKFILRVSNEEATTRYFQQLIAEGVRQGIREHIETCPAAMRNKRTNRMYDRGIVGLIMVGVAGAVSWLMNRLHLM